MQGSSRCSSFLKALRQQGQPSLWLIGSAQSWMLMSLWCSRSVTAFTRHAALLITAGYVQLCSQELGAATGYPLVLFHNSCTVSVCSCYGKSAISMASGWGTFVRLHDVRFRLHTLQIKVTRNELLTAGWNYSRCGNWHTPRTR